MRRLRGKAVLAGLVALAILGGGVGAALRSAPGTEGGALTDRAGATLEVRGFNTASNSKIAPDGMPKLTEADVEREHVDYGTNTVRFLISWRMVEPEPGRYDTAYLDRVETMVGWYAKRGYSVMLDMHQDVYSQFGDPPLGGNGAPAWAVHTDGLPWKPNPEMWELGYLEPAVMRAWDHFWNTTGEHPELMEHYAGAWGAVARHFADVPGVYAYDLMNEPYGGTLQGPQFESGPLTRLYQLSANAIRQADPDTWICVSPQAMGTNWGTPSGLGRIEDPRSGDPRIAYCPHLYPLMLDLGSGYNGSSRAQIDTTVDLWRDNVLRTAHRLGDVPIILDEFGLDTTQDGALDYVRLVLRTTDEMGAGWIYWSSDPGSWGPYEEDGRIRNLVDVLGASAPKP